MLNKVVSKIHLNYETKHTKLDETQMTQSADTLILDELECLAPNKDGGTFKSLTLAKYRRAFTVGLMLGVLQQATGINLIIFYSNKVVLFQSVNSTAFTTTLGVINVISTIVAMFLFQYVGRK